MLFSKTQQHLNQKERIILSNNIKGLKSLEFQVMHFELLKKKKSCILAADNCSGHDFGAPTHYCLQRLKTPNV